MFEGRKLVIATKHKKESVLTPLLEKGLDVKCFVPDYFDTDLLGTFTGEVERTDDPIATARKKCLLAMEEFDCDMAVASEGSFGIHPAMFFAYADEEILFFIDKKSKLEISVREICTETNFNGSEIKTAQDLKDFAKYAKFPTHGLIIKKSKEKFTETVKGITDWKKLNTTFHEFIEKYGSAFVETDMRAMYNPTRMKAIEMAAKKLIDKINSCCPNCNTAGFGITDRKEGLPCNLCGFKTRSTLSYIYTCQKCFYTKEAMYPNNITKEDPTYCDMCNP